MPTSTIIGDVLGLRDGKVAARTGAAAYGTVRDLYGIVNLSADARLVNAIREGDGKELAIYSRIVGGTINLEFAANNLQIFADILGLTYSTSGSTPNQVGTLQILDLAVPYFGFAAGADDDNGLENAFHLWAPKLKIISDTIRLVNAGGNLSPEFGNASIECRAVPDNAYIVGAQNDVQDVDITGAPVGGDFTLALGSETTAAIAYDADASAVQTALEALNNIGSGNVVVTGTNPNFVVTFQGALANLKLPTLTADGSGLTGGSSPDVIVTHTTDGSEGNELILTLYEDEQGTSPLIPPAL